MRDWEPGFYFSVYRGNDHPVQHYFVVEDGEGEPWKAPGGRIISVVQVPDPDPDKTLEEAMSDDAKTVTPGELALIALAAACGVSDPVSVLDAATERWPDWEVGAPTRGELREFIEWARPRG